MALWRSLPSFEGKADPGTWLYRVALNTALSHDRRQAVREEATLSDDNPLRAGSVPSPDATVEEHDVELPYATVHGIVRYDLEAKPKAPRPSHPKKSERKQVAFKKELPSRIEAIRAEAERPVRLFCQDESRFGLMPVTRRRNTRSGVKPIQQQRPAYQSYYLYGAVEPKTGNRFLLERESLNSDGFQEFLDGFSGRFSESLNVLVLDNGQFHKAKSLSIPDNVRLLFLPPYRN